MSIGLRYNGTKLTREYCPRCGDHAIFRSGVCVRTGCGHKLKEGPAWSTRSPYRESTKRKNEARANWRRIADQECLAKWQRENGT